jgi:two-component system, OmpR family, response regulator VicR
VKILLADDDLDLLDVTTYALRREGFDLISATDGEHALRRWQDDQPDLVVLDLGLPHVTGFEVCQRIRRSSTIPIIILTGRHDDDSVVHGFQVGADDYITKPFSPRQLAMRIRAIWRRMATESQSEALPKLRLRELDLILDPELLEVYFGDRVEKLTPLEFRIFHLLVTNAGRVVGTERLIQHAWGYAGGDTAGLKTHLSHLRKKLRVPRGHPGYISAVNGAGYRLSLMKDD